MTALLDTRPGPLPVASRAAPTRLGLLQSGWTKGAGLVVAGGGLVVVVFASLAYGAKPMALASVWDAVFHYDGTDADHLIVRSLRVPRTILGLAVGAALGVAGGVMQGVTRNPLADPGLLGIEAGASLAVVIAIYSFGVTELTGYVWFAFAGAAVASAIVYSLGSLGRGGATPVKLALAGAALGSLFSSFTSAILLLDVATLDQYRFWVVGSLSGRDMTVVEQVLPFIVAGLVLALGSARQLNVLALGDDMARTLGQRVQLARLVSSVGIILLCGAATAACGPIAFVGLTIPHVARAICGPDYRWILPWTVVLSPILLLGADIIGRVVTRPGELQVGIVTALIGAPFFILLVRRRKLAELWTAIAAPVPERLDRLVVLRSRRLGWSTRVHARAVAVTTIMLVLAFVVFCWSLAVGDYPVSIADVLATLAGGGNEDSTFIVRTLRLPRGLTALLVGAAFGLSGAVFQRLARNPLASPDIIGINAGAAAAAVFVIVVVHGTDRQVTLAALGGSLVTAALVYLLAYKKGVTGYRLVLVGVGVTAMLSSVTSYLLTRAEIFDAQRATVWLTGSLNGRGWEHVRPIALALALLLPLTVGLARHLRMLELGDDAAKGLGTPVERSRAVLLLGATALAAIAVASAGPIGFVALVAPQIARRLVGGRSLGLVPSAACGALLLVTSDLIARRLFAPEELPVGIVTAILGAPYLLFLLARANRIGAGG